MPKTDFKSVDAYLATMPDKTRAVLEEVRALIRAELPEAEEGISYQIPTFKQEGVAVIYLAGWKEHFSLYPVGDTFVEAFPEEAQRYSVGKGTIKFPLEEKVPKTLIRKIVKLRAKAARQAAEAKKAKKKA